MKQDLPQELPLNKVPLNVILESGQHAPQLLGQQAESQFSLESKRLVNRIAAFKNKYPRTPAYLFLLGALSVGMSYTLSFQAKRNQKKIQAMKSQLSQPVVDVNDHNSLFDQNGNPNSLHRIVKITGRPIHRKGMMIPVESYGLRGYEYLVPFVTKENEDETVQEGLILNLGFIPPEYAEVSQRPRVENADYQEFTCVVNDSEHLTSQGGLLACNDLKRNKWQYANMKQLAQHTVNPDTELNERNCQHLDINSDYRENFPYRFTRSGILQQPGNMYWDLNRRSQNYFNIGVGSLVLSILFAMPK